MSTWHIHIQGQVQGVGFRPFVYAIAKKHHLKGWVNNATDGVHIEFNSGRETALNFYDLVVSKPPSLSKITSHTLHEAKPTHYTSFEIVNSNEEGVPNLILTPDFALCHDCRRELLEVENRRFEYPFITCTHCGPRYSIINSLPYDRDYTEMKNFCMCKLCIAEYENINDRRYYSQTNSCSDCGINIKVLKKNTPLEHQIQKEKTDGILVAWEKGEIVAIKGIGGYLLTCASDNDDSVKKLRTKKYRPSKPFAMMYPNLALVKKHFDLNAKEIDLLQSSVSPIVLLTPKSEKLNDRLFNIAPHLNCAGIMIPYTPLLELLLAKYGKPIIATSGNVSNAPIIYQDSKAEKDLFEIADVIVSNDRDIVLPQDDSVIKLTTFKKRKIVLRRSRGIAPCYINLNLNVPDKNILGMGAMLKSTFSMTHQGNIYVSQYIGDLQSFETEASYQSILEHLSTLLRFKPECVICDLHQDYASTRLGKDLAKEKNCKLYNVQHHVAHFGAVLAENNLMDSLEPILGVVWDGVGLGNDKQIWGGEFFKYENHDFLRCYYFDYFDYILGDKMSKEPRVSALSACYDVMGAEPILKEKFSEQEWRIYTTKLNYESNIKTSSVGRIFDAVASLLKIIDIQTFEGEAAMRLETVARKYFEKHGLDFSESYFMEGAHYYRIPTKTLITNIILDIKKGKQIEFIAAKFHYSLVQIIRIVANNLGMKNIAFSGGVFQNGLLVDLIYHHLEKEFELFVHDSLPSNDENISFGQIMCYLISQKKRSLKE